jgi:DNA-binding NarL/FixJ family response regulator
MTTSVLVIDDDPGFRALAVRVLAGMGLAVVGEAHDIASGTDAANRLRPQAALVDVGLPDGDGVALARVLAGLPWSPRVVLTSSDRDATTDADARLAGAAGFIVKDDILSSQLSLLLTGRAGRE